MPEELIPVIRRKEVKPEGAETDAATFRDLASRCRCLADDLRGLRTRLDLKWKGKSRERFFYDCGFDLAPNDLDRLAEWLEEQERWIDQKMVTVEYTVLVPVCYPWE